MANKRDKLAADKLIICNPINKSTLIVRLANLWIADRTGKQPFNAFRQLNRIVCNNELLLGGRIKTEV